MHQQHHSRGVLGREFVHGGGEFDEFVGEFDAVGAVALLRRRRQMAQLAAAPGQLAWEG